MVVPTLEAALRVVQGGSNPKALLTISLVLKCPDIWSSSDNGQQDMVYKSGAKNCCILLSPIESAEQFSTRHRDCFISTPNSHDFK